MLEIILFIALFVLIFSESVCFFVYGGYVSKEISSIYMNLEEKDLRLNSFDPTILSCKYFVSKTHTSLTSCYYINGFGMIPRWSKLHKKIKEYYAIALKNEFN